MGAHWYLLCVCDYLIGWLHLEIRICLKCKDIGHPVCFNPDLKHLSMFILHLQQNKLLVISVVFFVLCLIYAFSQWTLTGLL